jgi:hypothetical protein
MVAVQERRQFSRQPAQYPIRFYYTDNLSKTVPARTIDLTTQGACIESPESLPQGASVKFFVIAPTNQVIDVVGRVVHVDRSNQAPFRVGVRFTQLANNHRQILARELQKMHNAA